MIHKFDEEQLKIKNKLDKLACDLERDNKYSKQRKIWHFFKKILHILNKQPKFKYKNYYIYGEVGRGKTILMKDFQKNLHQTPKIYFHFHDFMNKIHQNLHELRSIKSKKISKNSNEIHIILDKIIGDNQVICFDEFQVFDIADAMLLSKIFKYFFKNNKVLIITANYHPLDLYQNGIQRELFLKFIKNYFLKHIELLNLISPTDYRLHNRSYIAQRIFNQNITDQQIFNNIITQLTQNDKASKHEIIAWGRKIILENSFEKNKILILDYNNFFKNKLSTLEFNLISKKYNLIIIKNFVEFNIESIRVGGSDEIRKFTLFIDELYENKTALILSGEISMNYFAMIAKQIPFFLRTNSRMNEIFSDNYWQHSKFNLK